MSSMRVMQINSGEKFGGISAIILELYRNMNHDKVHFDFVAPNVSSFKQFENEISQMNGNIIELKAAGSLLTRKLKLSARLFKLLRKKKYDIVHINSGSLFFNFHIALIAKFAGIKIRIVHSHNSGNDSRIRLLLTCACKPLLSICATNFFACSSQAAKFMFTNGQINGKNYRLIKNGVNISSCQFNRSTRDEYRKKFNVENKIVFFNAGRLVLQKNQIRLLSIFKKFHEKNPNSVLFIAGEGPLKKQLLNTVKKYDLQSACVFLGLRRDVQKLMCMSDVFILPSKYEGLPVVGVEAQTNGITCIFSDAITDELNISPETNLFLSLSDSDESWVKKIEEMIIQTNSIDRSEGAKRVTAAGYSIEKIAYELEQKYFDLVRW